MKSVLKKGALVVGIYDSLADWSDWAIDIEKSALDLLQNHAEGGFAARAARLDSRLRPGSPEVMQSTVASRDTLRWLVGSQNEDILQLKGSTMHLLSQGRIPLRYTCDLDILFPVSRTPPRFERMPAAPHEAGSFCQEGHLTVDVHRYFPIFERRDGQWAFGTLDPNQLWDRACPHPEVQGGWLTSPEVAAIVTLAHLRKSFLEHPIEGNGAALRVGELLDLLEFTSEFANRELFLLQLPPEMVGTLSWVEQLRASLDLAQEFEIEVARGIVIRLPFLLSDLMLPWGALSRLLGSVSPGNVGGGDADYEYWTRGEAISVRKPFGDRAGGLDELRIATRRGAFRIRSTARGAELQGDTVLASQLDVGWVLSGSMIEFTMRVPAGGCLMTSARLNTNMPRDWQSFYDNVSAFAHVFQA